jgi:hypothetical protein
MFPAPLPRAKTRAEPREVRRVAIAEAQAKRDRKNAKRARDAQAMAMATCAPMTA